MPLVSKYEAVSAEEPDVAFMNGENNGRIGRKKKDGVYEQLSLGEADVEDDGDWNSLRRSDSFDEEDFEHQKQGQHTHFFELFGRRVSLSNFAVSTNIHLLFGPFCSCGGLHLPRTIVS